METSGVAKADELELSHMLLGNELGSAVAAALKHWVAGRLCGPPSEGSASQTAALNRA